MSTATQIHLAMVEAAMARNLTALRALYHDDYVYTGPDGIERKGPDAAVEVVTTYTTAFPDYDVVIVGQHQAGEDVSVIEFRATGTHLAELDGLPATGKPIDYCGCNIVEVCDDRIAREREYFDNVTILRQLGAAT